MANREKKRQEEGPQCHLAKIKSPFADFFFTDKVDIFRKYYLGFIVSVLVTSIYQIKTIFTVGESL